MNIRHPEWMYIWGVEKEILDTNIQGGGPSKELRGSDSVRVDKCTTGWVTRMESVYISLI